MITYVSVLVGTQVLHVLMILMIAILTRVYTVLVLTLEPTASHVIVIQDTKETHVAWVSITCFIESLFFLLFSSRAVNLKRNVYKKPSINLWTCATIISSISKGTLYTHRPIHWPLFVLGRKRPILYVASAELPPSIVIIMYGKWGPTRLHEATVKKFLEYNQEPLFSHHH